MNDQTEQTTTQPDAVPTRIELEDFIEAVSRGVVRALQAEEVSGYLQSTFPGQIQGWPGGITVGLIYNPPHPGTGVFGLPGTAAQ